MCVLAECMNQGVGVWLLNQFAITLGMMLADDPCLGLVYVPMITESVRNNTRHGVS